MLNVYAYGCALLRAGVGETDRTILPRSPHSLCVLVLWSAIKVSHLDTPIAEPTHQVTQYNFYSADFLTGTELSISLCRHLSPSCISSESDLYKSWKCLLIPHNHVH